MNYVYGNVIIFKCILDQNSEQNDAEGRVCILSFYVTDNSFTWSSVETFFACVASLNLK